MKIKLIFILLFILIFITAFSQKEYCLVKITDEKEFAGEQYYSVFQDSKGFIWLGSDMGVFRFDGQSLMHFTSLDGMPDNTVFGFFEDELNRIWCRTLSGKLCYISKERVYAINTINESIRKFIGSNLISSIYVHKNKIYLGIVGNNPLEISINKKTIKEIPVEEGLYLIKIHNHIAVYGIKTKDEEKFFHTINIYHSNALVAKLQTKNKLILEVPKIAFNDSTIFIANRNQIIALNENNILFEHVDPSNVISSIYLYNDNLFVGLRNNGIKVCKILNNKLSFKEKLINKFTTNLLIDKEENIWITTIEDGVYLIPTYRFLTFGNKYPVFKKNILFTKKYLNGLLFGLNDNTLLYYKDEKFYEIKYPEKSEGLLINAYVDSNNCWLVLQTKLKNKLILITDNKYSKSYDVEASIKDVYVTKNTILLATHNELCYFDLKSNITKTILKGRTNAVFVEMGTKKIFYGTQDGLFKLDTNNKKHSLLKKIRVNVIKQIDNEILAIGTHGNGLILIHKDTVIHLNIKNGLSGNFVKFIKYFHDHKLLYVGTSNAISQITFNERMQIKELIIFSNRTGLNSSIINDIEICNDTVFIAGNNGLTMFNINKLNLKNPTPKIFIKSIYYGNIEYKGSIDSSFIKFYYNSLNNLTINLDIFSYSFRENVEIKYRLLGLDSDTSWKTTYNQKIKFDNLPKGNYELQIKAKTIWNSNYSSLINVKITIAKHFWQETWFWLLSSFIIFMIIILITHKILNDAKNKQMLKHQLVESELKALRSQMNPHFIFNTLHSIQMFILKNDMQNADYYINSFSKLIRMILENSSRSKIPISEEIKMLRTYAELENLRLNDKFDLIVDYSSLSNIETTFIPSMLLQPIVENAIWHGISHLKNKRGLVKVSFFEENNYIVCIVEDNGIGRKKATEYASNISFKKSLGFQITENRINLLKGKGSLIEIVDLYDENNNASGTKVIIKIRNDD